MAQEYYSFEKVLDVLQLEEDELKRLVSEGEIRAFRDEDRMKFKRSDIESMRTRRTTEPTILLPRSPGAAPPASESSEVILVEDDTSETLIDISELDAIDSDDSSSTATVDLDLDASTEAEAPSGPGGVVTEPLQLDGGDEELQFPGSNRRAAPMPRPTRGTSPRTRQMDAPAPVRPRPGSAMSTALAALSFAVLAYAAAVALGLPAASEPEVARPATAISGTLRPPAFAGDPRVNPGALADGTLSDSERDWYRRWRAAGRSQ
ncbi:MAG: helix-turn-helix domain-containing protein [Planctomycetes bacterium]|nr:helix-turn-helix domain-containing protein [Planctomycetota bacterium]